MAKQVLAMYSPTGHAQDPLLNGVADRPDICHAPEFERVLLRDGLAAQAFGRETCAHCGRSPLPGEIMHRCEMESGSATICHVCKTTATDCNYTDAVAGERVRASLRSLAVSRPSAGRRGALVADGAVRKGRRREDVAKTGIHAMLEGFENAVGAFDPVGPRRAPSASAPAGAR